ncbi:hypothetical protein AB0I81_10215 [Nonomuraea sp. NPDC050404]|uniref:SCO4225 family membrane protein n=1 Tax=Nonomuraea sp. NPDC050404 TaxID=3155783 RepID=UPI0033F235D8
MRRYRNGRVATIIGGVYAALVALLGIVSVVILLTAQDPILLSGVVLMIITVPLGPLIWWAWGAIPPQSANPILLVVLLTAAGLLQSYLIWRIVRGPAVREDSDA